MAKLCLVYIKCYLIFNYSSNFIGAICMLMSLTGNGLAMVTGTLFSDPKTAISLTPVKLN